MGSEINNVVNNLCEKLGTSMDRLIPELAKLGATESFMLFIISVVIFSAGMYFLPKAWKYDHEDGNGLFYDRAFTIIPFLMIVIFFTIGACSLINLSGWLASPTAKAMLKIVSEVKSITVRHN